MKARVRCVRGEMRFGVGVGDKRSALRVARSRSRTVPNASSSRTMALNKYGWEATDVVIHASGMALFCTMLVLLIHVSKSICLFTPRLLQALSSTFLDTSTMSIRPRARRFLRMRSLSYRPII
jgi:hypothetical protein